MSVSDGKAEAVAVSDGSVYVMIVVLVERESNTLKARVEKNFMIAKKIERCTK